MTRNIGELYLWLTPSLDFIEPPKELDPYQKLFLALIMDAVETLKKPPTGDVPRYGGHRQYKTREARLHPFADAQAWLMSDGDDVLGFVSICEYFDWDPNWVRKRALEAIEKARATGNKPGNLNRHLALPGPRARIWSKGRK